MPRGDGTGPTGKGPMSGRRGRAGMGGGRGQGRMGGPTAAGVGGTCRCLKCGYSERHERGSPCAQKTCPKCGTALTRDA